MFVRDKMSKPVITVEPRTSIQECLTLMMEKNLRRIPVTASDGTLKGIISFVDIDKATRSPGVIPQTPVEWLMVKNPVSVPVDAELAEALRVMQKYKVSTLPVVEGEKVVGVFSVSDALSMCLEMLENQN